MHAMRLGGYASQDATVFNRFSSIPNETENSKQEHNSTMSRYSSTKKFLNSYENGRLFSKNGLLGYVIDVPRKSDQNEGISRFKAECPNIGFLDEGR
jgi:hypothetical protein